VARNFLFSKDVQEFSGVQPASISMDTGPPSRGEVYHLPPPSAEELYLYSTCLSSWSGPPKYLQ